LFSQWTPSYVEHVAGKNIEISGLSSIIWRHAMGEFPADWAFSLNEFARNQASRSALIALPSTR